MSEKNNTLELSKKPPDDNNKNITIGTVYNSVIGDNNRQFSQANNRDASKKKPSFLHALLESIIIKIILGLLGLLVTALAVIWGIKSA